MAAPAWASLGVRSPGVAPPGGWLLAACRGARSPAAACLAGVCPAARFLGVLPPAGCPQEAPLGPPSADHGPPLRSRGWGPVGLLVAGGLLAWWVLGAAWPRWGTQLLGLEYVDAYGTQWFYWATQQAMAGEGGLLHSPWFFYPWGKDVLAHTGANVLDALQAAPWLGALGHVAGYNSFVVFSLVLTFLAGIWALRPWVQGPAAWCASLLLAAQPVVLFELLEGRPTQAILWPLVLALGGAWRLAAQPGPVGGVALGLGLALSGYQYWYYGFFGALGAVAVVVGVLPGLPRAERLGRLGRLVGAGLLCAALCAPLVVPLALRLGDAAQPVPGLLDVASWRWDEAPLRSVEGLRVGLFTFQPLRWEVGFLMAEPQGGERFYAFPVPLSLGWLALAALGLVWHPPLRRPALLGLGALLLVVVGPTVLWGDAGLPNPVYVGLLKLLPPLRRLWFPERGLAVLVILLLPAVALGVEGLGARLGRYRGVLPLGLVLALVAELRPQGLAPMPSWDATVPAGYRCLASGPPGAIVELPMEWNKAHLYYQSAHGRPMLGGMLELNPLFTPAEHQALLRDNSYLQALRGAVERAQPGAETWTPAHREALGALGYRYVVLRKDALGKARPGRPDPAITRLAQVAGEPVYEDARVALYAPWGGGSPCADEPPTPDPRPVGRTDTAVQARTLRVLDVR